VTGGATGEPGRRSLAAAQAGFVRALVAGGEVPDGFDPERLRATAVSLRRKRAREVARAWPALAAAMADAWTSRFVAYADGRPPPAGGALADGLAFADALAGAGELPAAARTERLAARARLVGRPGGYLPRRGPFVGAAVEPDPRRLAVLVRAPLLGERWLLVPLPGGRHELAVPAGGRHMSVDDVSSVPTHEALRGAPRHGREEIVRQPTYFVLAALLDGPLHGYGIIQAAERLSGGQVRLSTGTLYGALDRLGGEGLVAADGEEVVDGRARRYYRLTDAGRRALAQEAARMRRDARVVTERLRRPGEGRLLGGHP